MTVPNFLSSSFAPFRYYTERVTDMTSVLTTLTAELVTNPALADKWTEAPAGTFQCPSDASGRWMKCAFTRISANVMQMILTDNSGNTICTRRASGTTAGFYATYYTGKFHCFLEFMSESTSPAYNFLSAWLMDITPDPLASCPYPVVGNGTLNSGGNADGYGVIQYLFAVDGAVPAATQRMKGSATIGNTSVNMSMPSGRGFYDECLISQNVGGTIYWTGRLCQALLGPGLPTAVGVETQVPVDDGTMATFKATLLNETTPYRWRLWMRKA